MPRMHRGRCFAASIFSEAAAFNHLDTDALKSIDPASLFTQLSTVRRKFAYCLETFFKKELL